VMADGDILSVRPWMNTFGVTCPVCGALNGNAHSARQCWGFCEAVEKFRHEIRDFVEALQRAEEFE
jgi:hypothetical protein